VISFVEFFMELGVFKKANMVSQRSGLFEVILSHYKKLSIFF